MNFMTLEFTMIERLNKISRFLLHATLQNEDDRISVLQITFPTERSDLLGVLDYKDSSSLFYNIVVTMVMI